VRVQLHAWLQEGAMSSSDRTARRGDRPERNSPSPTGEGPAAGDMPVQPPRYLEPAEPWDAQSAEALTQLYESGEGYLHKRPEDECAPPPRSPRPESPEAAPADHDGAWLEARLKEMAERLQHSLARMNPDKPVEHFNRRLDAIEERFSEALGRVVHRSDLEGLERIEGQVLELTARIEEARSRLDRIDSIDEQVQGLARRIEEADFQRLDALERLLQEYLAEWRRSDEKTGAALQSLEGAVGRIGDSIEALEAQKPASDLSLSVFGSEAGEAPPGGADPLSQVYADAARVLEPGPSHASSLDAADYVPSTLDDSSAQPLREASPPPAAPEAAASSDASLSSPSFRALAMRAKLRQTQLLGGQAGPGDAKQSLKPDSTPAPESSSKPRWRIRSSLLLAGGVTLFAAIGYLLVDVLMAMSAAPIALPEAKQSAGTIVEEAGAPASASEAHASSSEASRPLVFARIEALGSVMAAALRDREAPSTPDGLTVAMTSLPMTIGPASLRQSALRGDPEAQVEVAARFAAGRGVKRDLQQALKWYARAAAQGSAIAQYRLGSFHERGLGTAPDPERARVWYARAAEQGNVNAMHNLAVASVSGGRSDYAAAAKWFAQAAEFGLADSQVNLAILYLKGLGVPKDVAKAYKWLTLAARGGDREAATRIPEIAARLSAAELQAADAAIGAWRARTPDAGANEAAATASLQGTP
jgi:localization factor PodJL